MQALKKIDNKLFNNKVIKNQDINYVIGLLLALTSVAIIHGYLTIPNILNNVIFKTVYLVMLVLLGRHNIILSVILGTFYLVLTNYSNNTEQFDGDNNDNDTDDDDDDDDGDADGDGNADGDADGNTDGNTDGNGDGDQNDADQNDDDTDQNDADDQHDDTDDTDDDEKEDNNESSSLVKNDNKLNSKQNNSCIRNCLVQNVSDNCKDFCNGTGETDANPEDYSNNRKQLNKLKKKMKNSIKTLK